MDDGRIRESDVGEAQAGNIRRHRHHDVSLNALLDGVGLELVRLAGGDHFPIIVSYWVVGETWLETDPILIVGET